MKVAVYLDEVSNSIDNAMQWGIMRSISAGLVGVDVLIIDPLIIGKNESIKLLLQQDYDVLLTYNKTGTNLSVDIEGKRESIFGIIKRRHISWLTEHPLTFFEQYLNSNCDRHYIFPNESHSDFSKFMGLQGSYSVQMFGAEPIEFQNSYNSREYDVCIAAQWRGPAEANAFWLGKGGILQEFFEDVIKFQDNFVRRDTFEAFLLAAKNHGLPIDKIVDGVPAMREMYWFARKKERINLVRDFANSGLKISLIGGDAWKKILPNHEKIHFIEPLSHCEVRNWYLKCKSVVTLNNFNGANERVFDAMSAGALPFCENSPDLIELLGDDQAIFYSPNKAKEKIDQLRHTLSSGLAEEMTEKAHQNFINNHTWSHRGVYLKNLMDNLLID